MFSFLVVVVGLNTYEFREIIERLEEEKKTLLSITSRLLDEDCLLTGSLSLGKTAMVSSYSFCCTSG
jgi:hypothetical protein